MSEWEIIRGDCREVLPRLPDGCLHACVTDPPYNLSSPGRAGGFMNMSWDATRIAFEVATWREILRLLKPGGHLAAFGGTRTYHRMACAIEDAGFEIRDSIHWIYGTGFPKSRSLGDGLGTALKPGHEPIVLARKPFEGTVAANILMNGTGAINVDVCRIETKDPLTRRLGRSTTSPSGWRSTKRSEIAGKDGGRWPPNVALDEAVASELGERSRYFYVAKASRAERDKGCEAMPAVTGGAITGGRVEGSAGLRSPRAGAGRTSGGRNTHPTVKPVALMRWLVRLVTPPGGVVLDPFAGSGSTGVACVAEGVNFLGVEQCEEYVVIAEARLKAAEVADES